VRNGGLLDISDDGFGELDGVIGPGGSNEEHWNDRAKVSPVDSLSRAERRPLTALGARLYALKPRFRALGLARLGRLPLLTSRLQLCQLPCDARLDRIILLLRPRFVLVHGFGIDRFSLWLGSSVRS
jgi:hypothetical protein